MGKYNCKTRREIFMFGDWVWLILENWRYIHDYATLEYFGDDVFNPLGYRIHFSIFWICISSRDQAAVRIPSVCLSLCLYVCLYVCNMYVCLSLTPFSLYRYSCHNWNGSNLGFPGISWRRNGRKSLKFCMLMYPDHLQNWLDFGHGSLIFMSFRSHIYLLKQAKFWFSRHLPENTQREWPKILHADLSWPLSELIIFLSCSVDFPHYGHWCPFWLSETGHISLS